MRRARGYLDLSLAVLCFWAAAYHTPPGALVRAASARVLGVHSTARPLLSYYTAGLYAPALARTIVAPRGLFVPPAEALGYGAWSSLQELEGQPRAEALSLLRAEGLGEPRLQDPRGGPEALASALSRLGHELGSDDAAVLALFCGEDAARFARSRSGSSSLEELVQELPPGYAERASLAAQALTLGTAFSLSWPLPESTRITSPFGLREHPTLGGRRMHLGVDLGVAEGTQVRATAAGVVRRASSDAANGNMIVIDHGRGVSTVYCHNETLLVAEGARVAKGQLISRSGNTGRSTGPHLHYQLNLPGGPADPLRFRVRRAAPAAVALGGETD